MLTRSANASPVLPGFHYAPSHPSPRNSPSWNPATTTTASAAAAASAVRRPSSSSPCRVNGASASVLGAATASASAASVPSSPALSHAPSHAPSLSSSRPPTPLAASPAAPHHHPRPSPHALPRYVVRDAATQYSPMEPFDYATVPRYQHQPTSRPPSPAAAAPPHAPAASSSSQPAAEQSTPRKIPPIPGPVPMEPGIEQGVDHAAARGGASGGVAQGNGAPPLQGGGRPASGGMRVVHPPAPASAPAPAAAASPPREGVHPSPAAPPPDASSARPQPYTTSPQKRRLSHDASAGDGAQGEPGSSAGARRLPSPSVADSPPTAAKRAKPDAAPVKMLPEKYEFCAVEDMVVLIANMLGELIETNDALALKSGHLTRFHSRTPPGISVLDYLHRLAKHATLTPPLLLSMVYYIDRLCAMYPDFTINTLTVHRFLITAATVAAKGLSDSFWNNSTYARVGGVRVAELKMLELEFLYRLEWKIVPNPEVLAAYYRPLVERCPGYALPPDNSPSRDDDDMVDDDEDNNDGEPSKDIAVGSVADSGSAAPPRTGHNRQSSTSLIGEDMVVSGLTRQPTR